MVEAIGPEVQALRLIRDRDGIYGRAFDERVDGLGLKALRIAPWWPWQGIASGEWPACYRMPSK
jgi:hypothetical protein